MGRIAIISDIHANFFALQAVLHDIENKQVDEIVCLGDLVGYGSMPNECVTEIRNREITCLLGNHDSYLLGYSTCERSHIVNQIIQRHSLEVSDKNKNWLSNLKSSHRFYDVQFFHGGPRNETDQYIYKVSKKLFSDLNPQIKKLVCGHTHVQAVFNLNELTFLNPGSVGQPRDGDNRAAYAIFENNKFYLTRVNYDINAAMQDAYSKGYEGFCYKNLQHGTQIGGRVDSIRFNPTS